MKKTSKWVVNCKKISTNDAAKQSRKDDYSMDIAWINTKPEEKKTTEQKYEERMKDPF